MCAHEGLFVGGVVWKNVRAYRERREKQTQRRIDSTHANNVCDTEENAGIFILNVF